MRVLHVISGIPPSSGGTTFALAGLTAAQALAGLDVATFSTYFDGEESAGPDLFHPAVRMERLGPVARTMSRHRQLPRRIDELVGEFDVVHIHALWEMVQPLAAGAAASRGKPYLFTPHGMLQPWSMGQTLAKAAKKRLYLRLRLRRHLDRAARLHYTTPLERDHAARFGFRPEPLIEPNGINLDEFGALPPRGFLRARHPELADRPILLFLSRIHPVKGLDLTIKAFAAMAGRAETGSPSSRAMLVLAGPDESGHLDKVLAIAQSLGIGDRVVPAGFMDARQRLAALADADAFILSSYSENYGIAAAEAMAAGVPVLVSDQVQCHPEVVACDAGSVLPLDVTAFAAAIAKWLDDPDAARAAGQRGRAHALRHLGWDAVADRWVGHYDRMVRRHPHPALERK